jgi:hypothetical protein
MRLLIRRCFDGVLRFAVLALLASATLPSVFSADAPKLVQ